jgi:2-methylisocitrate lyase-like PEP mutase family enzyme
MKRLGFSDEDMANAGTDAFVDALVAWGDVEAITKRVQEHIDAGADHVCIQPLGGERRGVPSEQWRELAPALTHL